MGHETFSIFCDGPWNFVEEFRMGHQNFGGNIISPSGPPYQLLYDQSLRFTNDVFSYINCIHRMVGLLSILHHILVTYLLLNNLLNLVQYLPKKRR